MRKSLKVVSVVAALAIIGTAAVWFGRAVHMARERGHRGFCERGIMYEVGLSLLAYADEHAGSFPPNLKAIITTRHLTNARYFCCPGGRRTPGPLETVDEWTDFIYFPGHSTSSPSNTIILLCPGHGHGGPNVFFVDRRTQKY